MLWVQGDTRQARPSVPSLFSKDRSYAASHECSSMAGYCVTKGFSPCEAGRVKVFHALALRAVVIMKHIAQQAADVHAASGGSWACQAQILGLQDVES